MRILAISGSLRASSSNTALLEATVVVAPPDIQVHRYTRLGDLPHFNPDWDDERASPNVKKWRSQLQAADAVIFSTPEYAHGIPGVLKNALDWVVGSGELAGKPVTLFNASPRGTYAQAALTETLTVMSAKVVAEASITVNLLGKSLSASDITLHPIMSGSLRKGLGVLAQSITNAR